jgi:hypothetical protein
MRGIQIKLALNCFDFSLFDAIKNSIVQTKHIYNMAAIWIICCIQHDTVGLPVHDYIFSVFRKFSPN